jgi:hypothetical protein
VRGATQWQIKRGRDLFELCGAAAESNRTGWLLLSSTHTQQKTRTLFCARLQVSEREMLRRRRESVTRPINKELLSFFTRDK